MWPQARLIFVFLLGVGVVGFGQGVGGRVSASGLAGGGAWGATGGVWVGGAAAWGVWAGAGCGAVRARSAAAAWMAEARTKPATQVCG